MKSLEGGSGSSTTSKKIIVYKKSNYPIRFYDVKGTENQNTVDNYYKIMTQFNDNDCISHDSINVIFYCIEYKKDGTIIQQMENILFEKLINCNIPIYFIITKTPHNPDEDEDEIQNAKEKIENNINSLIKESFRNNKVENDKHKIEEKNEKKGEKIEENDKQNIEENDEQKIENPGQNIERKEKKLENDEQKLDDEQKLENDAQQFIDKYTKIFFVNLVREKKNPIFGIDKVLSSLSELVPEKDWNDLEEACLQNDKDKCKELLKKNYFLRYYSELDNLNKINLEEAKRYLKNLKAGAFFSGIIPGLDIGMEYYYKFLFKNKLKCLYGFDYTEAKEAVNKSKKKEMKIKSIKGTDKSKIQNLEKIIEDNNDSDNEKSDLILEEKELESNDRDDKSIDIKKEEEKIESKINEKIKSGGKNASSIFRGIFEAGGIVIKALPESGSIFARISINSGIKVVSWALLPVTCIGFGTWSVIKVHKDCKKMIQIFQEAFISLKCQTLSKYLESIKGTINHLKVLGEQLIEDDKKKEEE